MKIFSWNCRGLEKLSTISQLKEEIRINLPDFIFLCETKNKIEFIQAVCKKIKRMVRWEIVAPRDLSEGLLLGCSDQIIVKQNVPTDFCIEVEFKEAGKSGSYWRVFVYASTERHHRSEQWKYLLQQKPKWNNI